MPARTYVTSRQLRDVVVLAHAVEQFRREYPTDRTPSAQELARRSAGLLSRARIVRLATTRWELVKAKLAEHKIAALRWEPGHWDKGSRTMLPAVLVLEG
jgi:hypothetical protein